VLQSLDQHVKGRFDRLVTYPYFASEAENMADRWFSATRIRKG
jgi:hypothetical protein